MQIIDDYNLWLSTVTDTDLLNDLRNIYGNEEEISDRFNSELRFGTAGLRAEMGAGPNRMNIYTVRRAACGLASYLRKTEPGNHVAIAYDNRTNSEKFAKTTAAALASNGIAVRIFPIITPVPVLSYAIRNLQCCAGVMITASHNTSEYNGFKCYNKDGCQMTDAASAAVTAEIDKLEPLISQIGSFDEFIASGLISYIDADLLEGYYQSVLSQSLFQGNVSAANLKVLYTPLCGTGLTHVQEVLERLGIKQLDIVESQKTPDPKFKTCPNPNPELETVFTESYKTAKRQKPDIILATDPDCDRLGVAVRSDGGYQLLSGNEIGILLANYLLSGRSEKGALPKNPVIAKSFVATPMVSALAKSYGCRTENLPVGFKYIGEFMTALEEGGQADCFILGFEESNGFITGMYARDKDAVLASMLVSEMAAWYKLGGLTLLDVLSSLYKEYGTYYDKVQSVTVKDMNAIAVFMDSLRANIPDMISGIPVTAASDYWLSEKVDLLTGERQGINLPATNALAYELGKTAKLTVRPSGTEPKLKLYYNSCADNMDEAKAVVNGLKSAMTALLAEQGLIR